MKTNYLITCVLIIYVMGIGAVSAQPTNPGFSVFEMTYGGGQANHIIPASNSAENSNYVLVGKIGGEGYIQNVNSNGALIWGKKITAPGIDALTSVVRTPDGGYAAVGTSYSIPGCITGITFYKFDANGALLYQKGYRDDHSGFNSASEAYAIQATSDGGYLIGGRTSGFSFGVECALLIKVDSTGCILWTRLLDNSSRIYSMEKTSDGGYILTGCSFTPSLGGVMLLRLDVSCNKLWSKVYSAGGSESGFCVKQTTDGGFIAVGYGVYTENPGFPSDINIFVVKTDQNGDTLWTRVIGDSLRRRAYYVIEVADGYILSGANGNGSQYGSQSCLIKTDKECNVLWHKNFNEVGTAMNFNYSIVEIGTGFLVAGVQNYGFSLIKTDQSGEDGCNSDGNAISYPISTNVSDIDFTEQPVTPVTVDINFTTVDYVNIDTACYSIITGVPSSDPPDNETMVYPNPTTTNYVNVVGMEKSIFSLFNSFGELVLQKKLDSKEELINLNLPVGIYFFSTSMGKTGRLVVSK